MGVRLGMVVVLAAGVLAGCDRPATGPLPEDARARLVECSAAASLTGGKTGDKAIDADPYRTGEAYHLFLMANAMADRVPETMDPVLVQARKDQLVALLKSGTAKAVMAQCHQAYPELVSQPELTLPENDLDAIMICAASSTQSNGNILKLAGVGAADQQALTRRLAGSIEEALAKRRMGIQGAGALVWSRFSTAMEMGPPSQVIALCHKTYP